MQAVVGTACNKAFWTHGRGTGMVTTHLSALAAHQALDLQAGGWAREQQNWLLLGTEYLLTASPVVHQPSDGRHVARSHSLRADRAPPPPPPPVPHAVHPSGGHPASRSHRFRALGECSVPRGIAMILRLLHTPQLHPTYITLQAQGLSHGDGNVDEEDCIKQRAISLAFCTLRCPPPRSRPAVGGRTSRCLVQPC